MGVLPNIPRENGQDSPPSIDIASLGWDSGWTEELSRLEAPGVQPSRVVFEGKLAYRVVCARGELQAVVSGKILHERSCDADLPKVGDWVTIGKVPEQPAARIRHLLPRRNRISRKVPGKAASEQVLASNVDRVMVVQGLDSTFNLRRVERFVQTAVAGNSLPVIVLNKADLHERNDDRIREVDRAFSNVKTLVTSAITGLGLAELRIMIEPAKTVVFLGVSGAGKSSLINRLYGESIQEVLEVRREDAKGRHATSGRQLLLLPGGGLVIDTPGMRELQLWDTEAELAETFSDIVELAQGCRFTNCGHTVETSCAVRMAIADGKLAEERLTSFLKLSAELAGLVKASRGSGGRSRR